MKINFQYKIVISVVLLGTQITFAQKKDENIGSEVVNVVKPYTPTISDAFKVKETPSFEDEETNKKENIQYNIFSFPVASTFTPSKGKAASVDKSEKEKLFGNYATLAAGNYGTINAELFVTHTFENNDYIGAMLRHLSSQGGIKDLVLDDKFSNTSIDLIYGSKSNKLSWNTDLGFQTQMYNWYGLQTDLFTQTIIDNINPKQKYNNLYLGGRLILSGSPFKEASIKFSHFSDDFSSGENRFIAKPQLVIPVMQQKIKANFIFDYLNGSFAKDYFDSSAIKYGYTNIGFSPSVQINRENLAIDTGVSLFYSAASTAGENKFFVYPNISASFKVVGDLMVVYAGAEGTLKQNSFHDFVDTNFFVSPTLAIAPTDQKFDIYAGLKGKLANSIGYNLRASLMNEDNKAMFKNNELTFLNTNKDGYAFGNSFDVVYDNVKTMSFYGELKADFSKNVSFGLNGIFSSYTTDTEAEAWNLPTVKVAANLDFNITPKWYAGTNVYFVGERKDQFVFGGFVQTITDVTLDSYFDLNGHLGYKHNDRLTFFLKGNNLANQNYKKWINYPVQGFQVLLGANYKFDF